jgi:mono/diheme cytochrome c family protein
MNTKIQTLVKATFVAAFFAGALCRSAAAGDVTQLWNENCAACHGKDGKGRTMMGRKFQIKDMTDPKVQASYTDAKAIKTVKDGITENGKEKMKAFGSKLGDDDIKALVAQIRSFKAAK